MKTRNLIIAFALAFTGCHHHDDAAVARAPQPDFKPNKPKAMAARVPTSDGHRRISPTGWVFFETNSDRLTEAAEQDLDAAIDWLRAHPGEKIYVEGHADKSGPADYNLQLSFRRGIAVADYLAAHGVPRDRIAIDPQGERNANDGVIPGDRRAIIYSTTPSPR
jgi:outer membrane protein OmpA-like peptidoglycan-associated protein